MLRPRLEGLTDDEYLWEPAPGCWSMRPGDAGRYPFADVIQHVNAEVLSHGAEMCHLRDLYRARVGGA